jgi:hypothetical protein
MQPAMASPTTAQGPESEHTTPTRWRRTAATGKGADAVTMPDPRQHLVPVAAGDQFRVVAVLRPRSVDVPGGVLETIGEHDSFAEARRSGLHLTCLAMTESVDVYAPDGALECTWRATTPAGERDNVWHAVGPSALAEQAAFLARMTAEAKHGTPRPHRQ